MMENPVIKEQSRQWLESMLISHCIKVIDCGWPLIHQTATEKDFQSEITNFQAINQLPDPDKRIEAYHDSLKRLVELGWPHVDQILVSNNAKSIFSNAGIAIDLVSIRRQQAAQAKEPSTAPAPTPLEIGREREARILAGFKSLCAEYGIKLSDRSRCDHLDSRGDILFATKEALGEEFAALLNSAKPRCGVAGASIIPPDSNGAWCYLNHFEIEKLVQRLPALQDELSTALCDMWAIGLYQLDGKWEWVDVESCTERGFDTKLSAAESALQFWFGNNHRYREMDYGAALEEAFLKCDSVDQCYPELKARLLAKTDRLADHPAVAPQPHC